jgi:hypothetical protein
MKNALTTTQARTAIAVMPMTRVVVVPVERLTTDP